MLKLWIVAPVVVMLGLVVAGCATNDQPAPEDTATDPTNGSEARANTRATRAAKSEARASTREARVPEAPASPAVAKPEPTAMKAKPPEATDKSAAATAVLTPAKAKAPTSKPVTGKKEFPPRAGLPSLESLGPGTIITVAGGGVGDGGPAINASFETPLDLAVDAAGNLFIADRINDRIRRVDAATGIITTVAGNGEEGFGGDGGPASDALLDGPWGIAVDAAGNLFIADTGNDRIRRVDANTGIITTVVYTIEHSLGLTPYGVAVDAAGNLFIADRDNGVIRALRSSGSK